MRAAVASLVLAACSNAQPQGLPPAAEWHADDPAAAIAATPSTPRGTPSSDPHAGMMGGGGGADPHAGVVGAPPIAGRQGGAGSDPHAGVVGAPPIAGNAEAPPSAAGTVDVMQLGLSSPDPDRPIDPSRHIKGQLTVNAKVKDRLKPGAAVFLMVRKQGAGGAPGALVAVDRVLWSAAGQAFELSEKHAMVSGGPDLVGDLVVMARVDQDQDAMTKQPGDVTGLARVKIPATGVVLELDTVLP